MTRVCARPGCDRELVRSSGKPMRPDARFCSDRCRSWADHHVLDSDPVARFYRAAAGIRRRNTFAKHRVTRQDRAQSRTNG